LDYNEDHIDLFNQYLNGQLNEDGLRSFEKKLQTDSDFRESFERFQAIRSGIQLNAAGHLLSEMDEWDIEISNNQEGPSIRAPKNEPPNASITSQNKSKLVHTTSKNTLWNRALAVAASVLILSIAVWQLMPDTTHQNPPEGFEHYPSNIGIKRSSSPQDIPSDKVKAYNLYEIKEYKRAAPLLEKWYHSSGEQDALFYAGVAYYGSGDTQKAKEIFASQKWDGSQQSYIEKRF